jgi:sulfofructose kinase
MDIIVIGYNAFDVTVPFQGLPYLDSKNAVPEILHGGGGPGATAAVCLARLGARVRLVTVFGDDECASIQRHELESAGVDCSLSYTAADHRSAQAVILVDRQRETRTIFWSRGTLPELSSDAVDPQWLDGCDLLYCDGHEPLAAVRLARAARRRGLPVVLDAGSVREGIRELVTCCTDVISSRGFAPALTGFEDALQAMCALRALGPERVAMTFGHAGVLALSLTAEEAFHVPAYDVEVRDTTGAGDVFHAGYAFSRARGEPWHACLELGAAVAALKCRDWGGRRGLPSLIEAELMRTEGQKRPELPEGWKPG